MAPATRIAALAALIGFLVWPGTGYSGSVYRCDGPDGTMFSDTPCGEDARTVEVRDNRLGGMFGGELQDGATPTEDSQAAETEARDPVDANASPCRQFQSTNLRSDLIRGQVRKGMTQAHVREAWGPPSETYTEPVSMWVYDKKYYGRLVSITRVYFEQGCVISAENTAP